MFRSVGIVLVRDRVLTEENKIEEFFNTQLNLIKYQLEKFVVVAENENILTSELDSLRKEYDVLIVIGDLINNVVFKSLGNICNDDIDFNCELISKTNYKDVRLSSKIKLLSNENLSYPVIYFQRIFILKEQYAEVQFLDVLKSHLEVYVTSPLFKKYIKVLMNGNTTKIIDILHKVVTVEVQPENNTSVLSISSASFENIVKAEEMLRTELQNNILESNGDVNFMGIKYNSNEDYIHNSFEVISNCISKYGPENIFLSFNGGKDCTVLLHLVYIVLKTEYPNYKKPIFCLYVKSPEPFPEQDFFILQCQTYYNLDIMVVTSSIKEALQQVLLSKPNLKACLMGTRRTDPFSHNLNAFQMTDSDWPQIMRVNPLLEWHYSDIWDYILFYKIPYCKLYDLGYTSIGNRSNTVKNPSLAYFDAKLNKPMYLPGYKLMKESDERSGRNVLTCL